MEIKSERNCISLYAHVKAVRTAACRIRYIPPRARKYRINQNKIVKEIMGEDALKGVGESEPVTAKS